MNNLNLEYFIYQAYQYFESASSTINANYAAYVRNTKIVLILLDIIFFSILIWILRKTNEIRQAEKVRWAVPDLQFEPKEHHTVIDARWDKIQNYLLSDNVSDWKLAIIEADTILDEMVAQLPYSGDNLGERMKNIPSGDFKTIEDAWEAHKIRNQIAHQADYELTGREARRVINLYENVFKEFDLLT